MERSFRILEAYAACACSQTKLLCHLDAESQESVKEKLKGNPINSEKAKTRDENGKRKIDEMIVNGTYLYDPISFARMNGELTRELEQAIERVTRVGASGAGSGVLSASSAGGVNPLFVGREGGKELGAREQAI